MGEGKARTVEEMRFAARLLPCPDCGSHDLGAHEIEGRGTRWTIQALCPGCGRRRHFEFATLGDPTLARAGRFDLGAGASSLLAAKQFLRVFDDAVAKIPEEPGRLTPTVRQQMFAASTLGLTAVTELLKLVPPGGEALDGDPRLARKALEASYTRLRRVIDRLRPACTITPAMLEAHSAWLRRGGSGGGSLEMKGGSLADEWYGPVDLTFASLSGVDLTNVELHGAILDEAHLEGCTLHHAGLARTSLTSARILGGDWTLVDLSDARLDGTSIEGTTFARANLEDASLRGARIRQAVFDGARFGFGVFDGARFEGCSFRACTFKPLRKKVQPTSRQTHFIDCDFADVDFGARELGQTTFTRCRLARATPPLGVPDDLFLHDCDVSLRSFFGDG